MGPDGMMGNKPPMGNGMVKQAAGMMQNRPYQMHVQEAKSLGQQPMTPQEFMAQTQGR
jgi:hypothetical protein